MTARRKTAPAAYFRWTEDEVMAPLNDVWLGRARQRFAVGEVYKLEEVAERTDASHAQLMCATREAFSQLPESIQNSFASDDHLRYHALIECGFCREEIVDAGSREAALGVAAAIGRRSPYAHIVTRGRAVVIREARSQQKTGTDVMSKDEFEASKKALIDYYEWLVKIAPGTLLAHAGMAA